MDELEILNQLVNDIRTDIVTSMKQAGRFASGNTIDKMVIVPSDHKVQLVAPGYVDILERGRGPTDPNAAAGDPTLLTRIQAWCNDKGIDPKAAYAITKSIHKYGYKGKPGLLTDPLSQSNISIHTQAAAKNLAALIINSTLKISKP